MFGDNFERDRSMIVDPVVILCGILPGVCGDCVLSSLVCDAGRERNLSFHFNTVKLIYVWS